MSLTEYDMYIDGSFVGAEHNQRFESLNPENNQPWATFPDASESDVERSCLLYTSPSPRDMRRSRMPSSA